MADAEEGAAAPNHMQGQNQQPSQREGQIQQQTQQQQNQDAAGQQHLHINWSNFKPEFSENQRKMQRHIYYAQMTG